MVGSGWVRVRDGGRVGRVQVIQCGQLCLLLRD